MRYRIVNQIPFGLGLQVQETPTEALMQETPYYPPSGESMPPTAEGPEVTPAPTPAPTAALTRRRGEVGVQVSDASTGKFIANAKVSPLNAGGATLFMRNTGTDGKALFSESDPIAERPSFYKIEAEGYKPIQIPFVLGELVWVKLEPETGPLGIPVWGWAVGGLAAVGLIAWIATSK